MFTISNRKQINKQFDFYDCLRNWRTYTQSQLVELLFKLLSELTILNGLSKRVSKT